MEGYRIIEEFVSPEVNGVVKVIEHVASGAKILSIENDDTNKVFGVTFRTPVEDSTGVAHILEHMVLNGSKKYPLKEPFVDLLKGSLYTFLNAFTYPDRTVYPVASENTADFKNLVAVYLDAVFNPLLLPEVFAQEGWHYHKENDTWIFKGVVYNEMKGVYSSVDSVQGQLIQERLFPDTIYGYESGGAPREIVNLTHEQLKAFHHAHYVPGNALFYFYGDLPQAERLELLSEYLESFQVLKINDQKGESPHFLSLYDKERTKQEAWSEPRVVREKFVASEEQTKSWVTLNWKLSPIMTYTDYLEWELLQYVLIGTSGSVLRKKIIDTGWGTDLTGWGWDASLAEVIFSTGLKDMPIETSAQLEELIMKTLEELVMNGIEKDLIEAGLNTLEFTIRENNTGGYPRGLDLMLRVVPLWIYGRDWKSLITYEQALATLKSNLPTLSARLIARIQRDLIENTHRLKLELVPDVNLGSVLAAEEESLLTSRIALWTDEETRRAEALHAKVTEFQELLDTPELIALLPSLARNDLKREVLEIPSELVTCHGFSLLRQNIHTFGVGYVDVAIDFLHIDAELLLYLSLMVRSWVELGTKDFDYIAWQRRVDRLLGGLDAKVMTKVDVHNNLVAKVVFRLKALHDRKDELVDILREVLWHVQFSNKERVKQMIMEEIADFEGQLLSAGHAVVGSRVLAHLHPLGVLAEKLSGIDQLEFLRELLCHFDVQWELLLVKFETLREQLLHRKLLLVSISADQEEMEEWQEKVCGMLQTEFGDRESEVENKKNENHSATSAWELKLLEGAEVLSLPSQVNFVGWGGLLGKFDARGSVAMHILGLSYLWDRVRAKGGAYGARGAYDMVTSSVIMSSYRDPHVEQTLATYRGAGRFLADLSLGSRDVDRAVIGLVGQMDRPMLAEAQASAALSWYVTGASHAWRQSRRDEILEVQLADLYEMGKLLSGMLQEEIVVMGAEGVEKRLSLALLPAAEIHVKKIL